MALKCFGHQTITTSATAGTLDSGIYGGKAVQEALVTVEIAPVRITLHGTNPNDGTKLGHLFPLGATFRVDANDIPKLRHIQSGGTPAVLNISYYNNA